MKRFTHHVAGEKIPDYNSALETKAEVWELQGRVETLEREMEVVSTACLALLVVGGFFLYRWYVSNLGSLDRIPGVL